MPALQHDDDAAQVDDPITDGDVVGTHRPRSSGVAVAVAWAYLPDSRSSRSSSSAALSDLWSYRFRMGAARRTTPRDSARSVATTRVTSPLPGVTSKVIVPGEKGPATIVLT